MIENCKLCKVKNSTCRGLYACVALDAIDRLTAESFREVILSSQFETHVSFEEDEDLMKTIALPPKQLMRKKAKK